LKGKRFSLLDWREKQSHKRQLRWKQAQPKPTRTRSSIPGALPCCSPFIFIDFHDLILFVVQNQLRVALFDHARGEGGQASAGARR
jgi:hypothetical protein